MAMPGSDPLAMFALFESIEPEVRVTLARSCWRRAYAPRQVICDVNSPERDVMFIVEGTVTISSYARTGREIAFAELGAGQYFGEMSAIDGQPRSAAATARTDCILMVMPVERFRALVTHRPEVAWRVMTRLTTIIRTSNERLQSFSSQSVTQRVSHELLTLSKPSQAVPGVSVVHPIPTQADLGSRVGASRETVARVLLDLAQEGIIIRKGRTLTIPDPDRLSALVEGLRASGGAEKPPPDTPPSEPPTPASPGWRATAGNSSPR